MLLLALVYVVSLVLAGMIAHTAVELICWGWSLYG